MKLSKSVSYLISLLLSNATKKSLSSTIGYAVTAVHASKYGLGIEVQFPNLRGIKIDTNVPFTSFLNDILKEASDYAITRRFIVIPWDVTPIKTKAF